MLSWLSKITQHHLVLTVAYSKHVQPKKICYNLWQKHYVHQGCKGVYEMCEMEQNVMTRFMSSRLYRISFGVAIYSLQVLNKKWVFLNKKVAF